MELDGNAIAGIMRSVFGHELTTQLGTCASCGASGRRVPRVSPGAPGRSPGADSAAASS
jgi:hypothetical protein